jgi:hypothetical protein
MSWSRLSIESDWHCGDAWNTNIAVISSVTRNLPNVQR